MFAVLAVVGYPRAVLRRRYLEELLWEMVVPADNRLLMVVITICDIGIILCIVRNKGTVCAEIRFDL